MTNIQVHPDVASMEEQMQLLADVHAKWQEYVDWSTMRILVCGSLTEPLLAGMRQIAGSGVSMTIKTPLDGFTRLPSA